MLKQIILIAFTVGVASANLTFQNCGKWFTAFVQILLKILFTSPLSYSGIGSQSTIQALRIRGCDSTPCTFERGGSYYGEIDVIKGKTWKLFWWHKS